MNTPQFQSFLDDLNEVAVYHPTGFFPDTAISDVVSPKGVPPESLYILLSAWTGVSEEHISGMEHMGADETIQQLFLRVLQKS